MNAQLIAASEPARLPVVAEKEGDFQLAQRKAKAYASSTLVPQHYRDNVANVLIAMEIAQRIGANELMVMQNLYIVSGKPSWSSSFLIATVNACGRFTPIRFEADGGDDPSAKSYRVRAVAKDRETGEPCVGPWITWKMVEAEGWSKKSGSKWMTIPALMFMYRAAGFWSRVFAPELSMGILTREEAEDVWGGAQLPAAATTHEPGALKTLEAELTGEQPATYPEPTIVTFDEAMKRIREATDRDALDDAYSLIDLYQPAERELLTFAYNERADALELP